MRKLIRARRKYDRSRRRLGILKAATKASVAIPAPKKYATTCSRTKPRTRENAVAAETFPAEAAIDLSELLSIDKI